MAEPAPVGSRRRHNLADEVATHIRTAILAGRLRSGERIDQDAIADELGVSRLPVREALIALDKEGLVNTIPRKGSYVARIDREDIADHYEIFGQLSGGSQIEEIVEEVETLGRNALEAAEMIQAWNKG